MNLKGKLLPAFVILVLGGGAVAMVSEVLSRSDATGGFDVKVPVLSDMAMRGKGAFEANCAACHGANAAGTEQGPPLVHKIYNPGHHGDAAFFIAAKRGVRQHHWPFGDMPPLPDVAENDVRAIVQYVRELQLANGITYQPHNM